MYMVPYLISLEKPGAANARCDKLGCLWLSQLRRSRSWGYKVLGAGLFIGSRSMVHRLLFVLLSRTTFS